MGQKLGYLDRVAASKSGRAVNDNNLQSRCARHIIRILAHVIIDLLSVLSGVPGRCRVLYAQRSTILGVDWT